MTCIMCGKPTKKNKNGKYSKTCTQIIDGKPTSDCLAEFRSQKSRENHQAGILKSIREKPWLHSYYGVKSEKVKHLVEVVELPVTFVETKTPTAK